MPLKLSRRQYAEMFGPTVGDQVRLADSELFIEVERDLIAEAGDTKRVELVALAGTREVFGLNAKINGRLDAKKPAKKRK